MAEYTVDQALKAIQAIVEKTNVGDERRSIYTMNEFLEMNHLYRLGIHIPDIIDKFNVYPDKYSLFDPQDTEIRRNNIERRKEHGLSVEKDHNYLIEMHKIMQNRVQNTFKTDGCEGCDVSNERSTPADLFEIIRKVVEKIATDK